MVFTSPPVQQQFRFIFTSKLWVHVTVKSKDKEDYETTLSCDLNISKVIKLIYNIASKFV